MAEQHSILGGKVHLYQRNDSPIWQCSTYLAGKNRRKSTKEKSLAKAKDVAQDWFFTLHDQQRHGELTTGKTFSLAAKKFFEEYMAITAGDRNPQYVASLESRLRLHVLPFFGNKPLAAVNAGLMQEYRMQRLTPLADGKRPSKSSLHHEEVVGATGHENRLASRLD